MSVDWPVVIPWSIAAGLVILTVWVMVRRRSPGRVLGNEGQFGALLDSLSLALLVEDADGAILRVNPGFETLFGYASEEVLGRRNDGFLTLSEDRAILQDLDVQLRESGTAVAEFRGLRKDGSTFWVRASARRADELGEGMRLLTGEDITEVREARDEAERARALYQEMVETAGDLVWAVDREGRWTFLNSASRDVYGMEPGLLLGTGLTERSAPEKRAGDERALRRLLEGEEISGHETVHLAQDGKRVHLGFSGRPVIEGDRVVGARGIARDVGRLVASRAALTDVVRQQSLIQTFLAATPDIIFFKDERGVYRGCNEAFARLVGHPVGAIVGKTDHDLSPRDEADHYLHGDQEAFEAGAPLTIPSWETLASGERVFLETVKAPFFNPNGEPLGIVGIARDATERRRNEERLEALVVNAERESRRKSEFLSSMSHDIRTPLNGVLGMTELLLDTQLTRDQRKSAELIRSSAQVLLAILNDLLDLSRIQAGSLGLERVDFELDRVVRGAAGALGVEAAARGDEILVDVDPDVPRWVSGDAVRLRQILTKLLEGAIRYTEGGGILVRVRRLRDEEGIPRLSFSVTDTGTGIPPEQLEVILRGHPLQADLPATRQYGGMGLGLSIARSLVEMMGGRLSAAGGRGKENELSFELLLPEAQPRSAPSVPLRLASLEGIDVAVVDDNAVNRRILREFLEAAGARVEDLPGADAALSRVLERHREGRPFHALLIDSLMPDKDGFDLARMVRAQADVSGTPIVMATSAGDTAQEAQALGEGIDAFLAKPVSRSGLLLTLAATLGREGVGPGGLITPASVQRSIPRRRVLLAHSDPEARTTMASLLRDRGHHVDTVETGLEAAGAVEEGGEHAYHLALIDLGLREPDGPETSRRIRALPGADAMVVVGLSLHGLSGERRQCAEAGMNDVLAEPLELHQLLGIVEGWGGGSDRVALRGIEGEEGTEASASADAVDGAVDGATEGSTADARIGASAEAGQPDARRPDAHRSDAGAARRPERPALDLLAFERAMEAAGLGASAKPLLGNFREEAERRFGQLEQALEEGRHRSVAQVARAYRTAALHIHAVPLAEALARVEAAGRRGDWGRLDRLAAEVAELQAELLRSISEELS